MTQREIEAFVRKVLKETFGQDADPETVRSVAKKMAKTIPPVPEKKKIKKAA